MRASPSVRRPRAPRRAGSAGLHDQSRSVCRRPRRTSSFCFTFVKVLIQSGGQYAMTRADDQALFTNSSRRWRMLGPDLRRRCSRCPPSSRRRWASTSTAGSRGAGSMPALFDHVEDTVTLAPFQSSISRGSTACRRCSSRCSFTSSTGRRPSCPGSGVGRHAEGVRARRGVALFAGMQAIRAYVDGGAQDLAQEERLRAPGDAVARRVAPLRTARRHSRNRCHQDLSGQPRHGSRAVPQAVSLERNRDRLDRWTHSQATVPDQDPGVG